MSAIERMKELLVKYVQKRNWIILDCLNVWLHNGSGVTARSNFAELVLRGMMQDFYDNLKYNYSSDEIHKAIDSFQKDLKLVGVDLLYSDYYAMKRDIMSELADAMVKRILEKIFSEEERRLVFIFAKYYQAVSNPAYGISSTDLENFTKILKVLYSTIFVDDLGLQHPEDCLRKLGLILNVDWVVSRRPESSKELVVAKWSEDFLREIDSYVKVSPPKIVEKIEDYLQLLNQKDLVPQLVFYDLLLEKDAYDRTPFLKSEASIKDQMELLIPGSSANIPFRSGICERVDSNIMLSPFVKNKIERALNEVKRKRISAIVDKIVEAMKFFESEDKLLFDVRLISDSPRVWRIDGLTSSLSLVVMPWCKTSDVQFIKNISQKTSATVVFTTDQKLPVLNRLVGQDSKMSYCFISENIVTYTSDANELFQSILDQFVKAGNEIRLVEPIHEDIYKFPQIEKKDEGIISEGQLLEILTKGENEKVEFKKIKILSNAFHLAKSMAAIASTDGGLLLIGVTDDGQLQKIRVKKEHIETIINISRDKIDPPINPVVYPLKMEDGDVCVVEIPRMSRGSPYGVKSKDGKVYFIRIGPTIREPSNEEMRKLFER